MKKFSSFLIQHYSIILLTLAVLISGTIHAVNMFHYPYFENDEGTYMAQAWSFLSQGKLAPYTYWYDHAPVGWMFGSLWLVLTGGLFTFGFSLNSVRVFMLLLHILSTILLYKITKKISASDAAAFVACLFFALSPLGVYFQRRFLLDNIMTFWILVSLALVLFSRQRLFPIVLSAITFGIATLSKENGIFFMPVFVGLIMGTTHTSNRLFALSKWIAVTCIIISLYPLYALFKKELFPNGSIFSPSYPHVSLLGSLHAQASRGTGLPFWNRESDFRTNLSYWLATDPFFILMGSVALVFQAMASFFSKKSLVIFFLTVPMLAFLMSGKLVINFYIVPLLPFLGMCIGMSVVQILCITKKIHPIVYCFLVIVGIGGILGHYYTDQRLYIVLHNDETSNQITTINWIKTHLNPQKFIAIDYYGNLDLDNSRFPGDPKFTNADWYWKVELDPDVRNKKLHDTAKNITYTLFTFQMYKDMQTYDPHTSLLRIAVSNSRPIFVAKPADTEQFRSASYALTHPNGDWDVVLEQNTQADNLNFAWDTFKHEFIAANGRVSNFTDQITSREVSYVLLLAVAKGDKKTFDTVYSWAKTAMQVPKSSLFATSYGKKTNGTASILNAGTTTDADQAIAYALLLAYNKWNTVSYKTAAKALLADIWNSETAVIADKRTLVAGDWTASPQSSTYTLNPSYFAPAMYKLFEIYDDNHNWNQIADTSYIMLDVCSKASFTSSTALYLPPNWCNVTKSGLVAKTSQNSADTDFSYDAMRVLWNLSYDYYLTQDSRDLVYLQQINLLAKEWNKKEILSAYHHDGTPAATTESLSGYSMDLAYFFIVNPHIADEIYATKIVPTHVIDGSESYWGNKKDLYDSYWTWMSIALFTDRLQKPSVF